MLETLPVTRTVRYWMIQFVVGCFFISLCTGQLGTSSAEYYVTSGGSTCSGDECMAIDCPCPSIQAALDAAFLSNSSDITISLISARYPSENNSNLMYNKTGDLTIT